MVLGITGAACCSRIPARRGSDRERFGFLTNSANCFRLHPDVLDLVVGLHEPVVEGANRVTQEGFVIGTPDFLSPEQARNPAAVDIRADVYALGATLFYILTAKVPYEGANATEKMLRSLLTFHVSD